MKIYQMFSFVLILACIACQQAKRPNEEQTPTEETGQVELTDSTIWGHLGVDTGMSSIEFITDGNDTLKLYRTNPYTGEDGRFIGEVRNYNDCFGITLSADEESFITAINTSQLCQTWASDEGSINLKSDGSIISKRLPYNGWKLMNGHILLSSEQQLEYGITTRIDTMDIIRLDEDTLVIISNLNQRIIFSKKD